MSPNEIPRTEGPVNPNAGVNPGPGPSTPDPPSEARRPREPLYFTVIILLIADIVLGLGIALFAEKVIAFRPMAVGGLGLAGLGLGILAYFVLFGSGRSKR
jgi:hypothetical protein